MHVATPVTPQGGCRSKISAWPAGIISARSSCDTEHTPVTWQGTENHQPYWLWGNHRGSVSMNSVGPFCSYCNKHHHCCLTCTAGGLSFDKIRSGFQLMVKFQQLGRPQVSQSAVEIEGLRGWVLWSEQIPRNSCYTETIDESKMAGESPKINLQTGENVWLMSDTGTRENWKKDVKEMISCEGGHRKGTGDCWRGVQR